MWPLLLLGLTFGSIAVAETFSLFDSEDGETDAGSEDLALLESEELADPGSLLLELEEEGAVEALDLEPFAPPQDEYYIDFTATEGDDLIVLPEENSEEYPEFGAGSVVFGETGDDTMIGQDAGDVLFGDEGQDSLYGQDGQDQLFGGAGDDLLSGGEGDDFLTTETADGSDTLFGGSGDDTLHALGETDSGQLHHLSGGGGDDLVELDGGTHLVSLGSGSDQLTLEAGDEAGIATTALVTDFDSSEDGIVIMLESLPGAELSDPAPEFTFMLSEVESSLGTATLVEPATTDPELAESLDGALSGGAVLLLGVTPDEVDPASIQVTLSQPAEPAALTA